MVAVADEQSDMEQSTFIEVEYTTLYIVCCKCLIPVSSFIFMILLLFFFFLLIESVKYPSNSFTCIDDTSYSEGKLSVNELYIVSLTFFSMRFQFNSSVVLRPSVKSGTLSSKRDGSTILTCESEIGIIKILGVGEKDVVIEEDDVVPGDKTEIGFGVGGANGPVEGLVAVFSSITILPEGSLPLFPDDGEDCSVAPTANMTIKIKISIAKAPNIFFVFGEERFNQFGQSPARCDVYR